MAVLKLVERQGPRTEIAHRRPLACPGGAPAAGASAGALVQQLVGDAHSEVLDVRLREGHRRARAHERGVQQREDAAVAAVELLRDVLGELAPPGQYILPLRAGEPAGDHPWGGSALVAVADPEAARRGSAQFPPSPRRTSSSRLFLNSSRSHLASCGAPGRRGRRGRAQRTSAQSAIRSSTAGPVARRPTPAALCIFSAPSSPPLLPRGAAACLLQALVILASQRVVVDQAAAAQVDGSADPVNALGGGGHALAWFTLVGVWKGFCDAASHVATMTALLDGNSHASAPPA